MVITIGMRVDGRHKKSLKGKQKESRQQGQDTTEKQGEVGRGRSSRDDQLEWGKERQEQKGLEHCWGMTLDRG